MRIFQALLTVLLYVSVAKAQTPSIELPEILKPSSAGVGQLMQDLSFVDSVSVAGKLSDYQSKKAIVVMANLPGCPIGQKYFPKVKELHKYYQDKEVEFLYLRVGKQTERDIPAYLEKFGIKVRYLLDKDEELSKHFQFKSSTEVVILDQKRTVVYRGPIDDQYGLGVGLAAPKNQFLVEALSEVLAHKPVSIPALTAPGCVMNPEKLSIKPEVTYHNRISRIIQHRCEKCHHSEGIAGLELGSFDSVNGTASMITKVIKEKRMPPWPAEGDHFSNDISLSDEEKEDLLKWLSKKPRVVGDAKDAPVPYVWPTGWLLGKPDVVYSSKPFDVPDSGVVAYQYAEIASEFTEDRYVEQMEILPKAPTVVHHVLVFMDTTIESIKKGTGLQGFFMGMAPGQTTIKFPKGMGKTLPKGAKMVFQIHYTPNGEAVTDQIQFGMKFATKKPDIEVYTRSAYSTKIEIPPFTKGVKVSGTYEFKENTRIIAFSPHLHARGSAFEYVLVLPDKTKKVLLTVPRYDFNWQFTYWPQKPIDVPKGAILVATGEYDNTTTRNGMDPAQRVIFGEQTTDEMMIGYFYGYPL